MIKILLGLYLLTHTYSSLSLAQTKPKVIAQGATYSSPVDQELTINNLAILGVTDNLNGIYARPVEEKIKSLLKNHHRFELQTLPTTNPSATEYIDLEKSPQEIQKISAKTNIDGLITTRISKGPKGTALFMSLFSARTGLIIAKVESAEFERFDLPEVFLQTEKLLNELLARIPYQGRVLSRDNNRLTVNIGKRDGIEDGQLISAILILGVERHPQFQFILQSHKEPIGQIKILKAEDTLSFASIVFEKERGVIQKGTKLATTKNINYEVPATIAESSTNNGLADKNLDNPVAFEKDATEWLPTRTPSFGQVGIKIGFGSFASSTTLSSSGSLDGSSSLYPQIALDGELWINPQWTTRFEWEQGIASTDNPESGTPDSLSHSLGNFAVMIGYNILLEQEFFGPKVEVSAGFSSYSDSVDDSDPRGLTSMKYSGLTLGLRGQMPVTANKKWRAGVNLNFIFKPGLSETPVTSGASSSNAVSDFAITGSYQLRTNVLLTGDLNFRLYRATFTGTGTRSDGQTASSASQKLTTLSGGLVYMF